MNLTTVRMTDEEATEYIRKLAAELYASGACTVEARAIQIAGVIYVRDWEDEAAPIIQNPSTYADLYDNVLMDWDAMDLRSPRRLAVDVSRNRNLQDDLWLLRNKGIAALLS